MVVRRTAILGFFVDYFVSEAEDAHFLPFHSLLSIIIIRRYRCKTVSLACLSLFFFQYTYAHSWFLEFGALFGAFFSLQSDAS